MPDVAIRRRGRRFVDATFQIGHSRDLRESPRFDAWGVPENGTIYPEKWKKCQWENPGPRNPHPQLWIHA